MRTKVRVCKYFIIFVDNYINLRFFKKNIEAFALNLVIKNW
jgi:hypothetical protein